jgi:hypothetical protein
MEFKAELVKVAQRKKSLDNVYQISFETDNPLILDLGKLPADTIFRVDVDLETKMKQ